MMLRGLVIWGAVAISAVAGGASAEPAPGQYVVIMSNMNYGRLPATVKVGDKISWVNHDSVPHTVTARDHSFDLRVGPGQSAQMVVQKAGSFPFYCIYHSTMRGVLTVAAK
jgi:plastocyanin